MGKSQHNTKRTQASQGEMKSPLKSHFSYLIKSFFFSSFRNHFDNVRSDGSRKQIRFNTKGESADIQLFAATLQS